MPDPSPDDVVGLYRRDAARVARVVTDYERGRAAEAPGRTRVAPPTPIRSAKVTVDITARSGSTPGKGRADLHHYEGTSPVTLAPDVPAMNVEVLNDFGTAIAAGTWIKVVYSSGHWTLVTADC